VNKLGSVKTAYRDVDAEYNAVQAAFVHLQLHSDDQASIRTLEQANMALSGALMELERAVCDLQYRAVMDGATPGEGVATDPYPFRTI
jgi:hypothetical protein